MCKSWFSLMSLSKALPGIAFAAASCSSRVGQPDVFLSFVDDIAMKLSLLPYSRVRNTGTGGRLPGFQVVSGSERKCAAEFANATRQ